MFRFNIDHGILMNILRENTRDNRFLRLIEEALKAGYCEEWIHHPSLSGSPQGGIISPILSNIYMDRLDRLVEDTLTPEYMREEKRKDNPAYIHLSHELKREKQNGSKERSEALRKEMQQLPSRDIDDPDYRRLRYIRYADDFLLGFAGPLAEAQEIKERIAAFLGTQLKLTLSAEKTLVTHAATGKARFLGYDIGTMNAQTRLDRRKQRTVIGKIGFYIPEEVIEAKRKRYMRDGKATHRPQYLQDSDYDIITRYQGEYRGLVNYYAMAQNLAQLGHVRWTMETSLLKTLANKHRSSVVKETKRLQGTTKTSHGPRTCLKLTITREGKKPLVATFGGLSLKRLQNPAIKDQVSTNYVGWKSEIVERLLNDTCEVCGTKEKVQMHHVRKLRDLNKHGKREMPLWMKVMISRQRKSIPLCKRCHDDVHHNRPRTTRQGNRRAG